MIIVWIQEGKLTLDDKRLGAKAAICFLGSLVLAGITWWLGRNLGEKDDDSFRLIQSHSVRSEERADRTFLVILFVATGALLWSLIPGIAPTRILLVVGWLLVGFLGIHVRILLHELGHLAMAALLRFKLEKLQVGVGRHLGGFRLPNGLICEWRAWPNGGFLFARPRSTAQLRWRQALFVAGGPLMDACILWAAYHGLTFCFGGLGVAFVHGPAGLIASLLYWSTVISAVAGIIPVARWIGGRKIWTDGYLLAHLLIASRERIQALSCQVDWPQALELIQASDRMEMSGRSTTGTIPPAGTCKATPFPTQRARLASRLLPEAG